MEFDVVVSKHLWCTQSAVACLAPQCPGSTLRAQHFQGSFATQPHLSYSIIISLVYSCIALFQSNFNTTWTGRCYKYQEQSQVSNLASPTLTVSAAHPRRFRSVPGDIRSLLSVLLQTPVYLSNTLACLSILPCSYRPIRYTRLRELSDS